MTEQDVSREPQGQNANECLEIPLEKETRARKWKVVHPGRGVEILEAKEKC